PLHLVCQCHTQLVQKPLCPFVLRLTPALQCHIEPLGVGGNQLVFGNEQVYQHSCGSSGCLYICMGHHVCNVIIVVMANARYYRERELSNIKGKFVIVKTYQVLCSS